MSRWLQAARAASGFVTTNKTDITDETRAKREAAAQATQPLPVLSVSSARQLRHVPSPSPSAPAPSQDDADAFRHGRSPDGRPRTWTGRIVGLDEWRKLSAWDQHGPDGRLFCGICRAWVPPESCTHQRNVNRLQVPCRE